jgi:hypothetical protein
VKLGRIRHLAPGPWFHSVDAGEYDRLYAAEVLAPLDPERVRGELLRLAQGRVPVLCCFERGPPATCHRALIAEWFEKAGITRRELGHEGRPIIRCRCRPPGCAEPHLVPGPGEAVEAGVAAGGCLAAATSRRPP